MKIKLTKPQAKLLADLADGKNASLMYQPTVKLIDHGFAEEREGLFTNYVVITEKGRDHLNNLT